MSEKAIDLTEPERDPEDDARMRARASAARRRAEAGELQDDTEHLQRRIEQERRTLAAQ